ncbi:hypothetical protein ABIA00_003226 [Bradyrhizobium ottawaense]
MTRCVVRSLSILKRSVLNSLKKIRPSANLPLEKFGETTKRELFVEGVRFWVSVEANCMAVS